MSLGNSLKNVVNEARTNHCEGRLAGALRVCSVDPVVIKIQLERDGKKSKTRLLYLVT